MSFSSTFQTRYCETAQDGIIHHSSYAAYLEEARIAFFKTFGCDINTLEKQKIFCIVAGLSIQYLRPLLSGVEIEVRVSLKSRTKVRFELKYEIYCKNSLITTAVTSHCFLNASFKPIPIPLELNL